ncbi:hypothetical protein RvY_04077 [Ramazzottius varieornatus]|uniref:DUF659 domain-containing protein n=1 Tax=Ramazzottius varieornatus TaxID=947166 RepID=A0A1D1UTS2_RAMVA|nr:hypothetical protein RvY_04077 [Ramazzottius varieornatus]
MASRLDVWEHFERGEGKYKKTNHRVASRRASSAAPDTEQPTSGKDQLKARLKRPATQGSLMGFVDRPPTTSEKSQFERLLANAFLDCNMSFRSVENESFVELIKFLRPSVKLPNRITFSQRIVKDRIFEAVSEIDAVFSRQPTVTLAFDSFKNVFKNKLLGFVAVIRTENGTENHIFGKLENITGVSYTGDYVVEQVESALAIMRTKSNGTIQAVTCDSDGAKPKARTDLRKLHPETISLSCSAHQINLIFQEVFKFLPKFSAICKCALSIISWFSVSNQLLGRLFKL